MWWCDACGYEIASPGRCAQCTNPLEALPLAELSVGDPMNEVGYTLANWNARARSFLIEVLAQAEIAHRIEDDGELVVSIDDEACVDRIVADLSGSARGTSWLVKSTKGSNEPPLAVTPSVSVGASPTQMHPVRERMDAGLPGNHVPGLRWRACRRGTR